MSTTTRRLASAPPVYITHKAYNAPQGYAPASNDFGLSSGMFSIHYDDEFIYTLSYSTLALFIFVFAISNRLRVNILAVAGVQDVKRDLRGALTKAMVTKNAALRNGRDVYRPREGLKKKRFSVLKCQSETGTNGVLGGGGVVGEAHRGTQNSVAKEKTTKDVKRMLSRQMSRKKGKVIRRVTVADARMRSSTITEQDYHGNPFLIIFATESMQWLRQIFFIAYDFLDLLVAMGLGLIGMSTAPNVFYDTRGEGYPMGLLRITTQIFPYVVSVVFIFPRLIENQVWIFAVVQACESEGDKLLKEVVDEQKMEARLMEQLSGFLTCDYESRLRLRLKGRRQSSLGVEQLDREKKAVVDEMYHVIASLDENKEKIVQDDLQFYLYEVCHWHFTEREWNTLWDTIDVDHSNSIDREEFEETIFWATRHGQEQELLQQAKEESMKLKGKSELLVSRRKKLNTGTGAAFGSLRAVRECFGDKLIVTCQRCGKLVNAYQMSMHAPACHRSGGPGSAGIRDEKSVLGVGQGGHLQSLRENTHLADETVTTKAALSDKYKISHKIYPLEE